MTISSKQIRAARGLLNLSQKELAEKSNLSVNSLNNIERDVGSPRVDSMRAIEDALAAEGVEFLEKDGVRLGGEELKIKRFEGSEILTNMYADMIRAFPSGGGEILVMGKDNGRLKHFDSVSSLLAYKQFEDYAIKNNVGERCMFLENDTNFLSSRNGYRWVPRELFGEVPMTIYGNNIAIVLWGPPVRMIVIRNPGIAETFRRHFEAVWKLAKPVPDEIHRFHYNMKAKKVLDQAQKKTKTKAKK